MKKRFVAVPEGKILRARAGGYVFVGPCFVSLTDKFLLPETYIDEDPLIYTDTKVMPDEKPHSPWPDAAPSVDSSDGGSGSKDVGTSSSDVRTSDAVREHASEDHEPERVHGKREHSDELRLRFGERIPSEFVPAEPAEDVAEGGHDSDSLEHEA